MSAQDYFHEKAGESRHNEMLGYVMFLAGSVFFVGGILSALSMGGDPSWFLLIPYVSGSTQALYLEVAFLLTGLSMMVGGIAFGLYSNHDRSLYMSELCKARNSDKLLTDFRAKNGSAIRKKKH
jgi:hypothetical protein